MRANAPDAELAQLRRALKLAPRSAKAHAELGLALQRAGQFAPAVASQRRALELDPGMVRLHGIMAPALHALAEYPAAADSYRKAIALQPDNAALHYGLGEALRALADYPAAESSYRRALQLRPHDQYAYTGLAGALHGLGDLDGAAAAYSQALAIAPDHVDALLNLGNTSLRQGQFTIAADAYNGVLKVRPDHYDARINLGVTLASLDQHEAALACYRQALAGRPNDQVAQRHISSTLARLGKHAEALAFREALRDAAPDNGLFHFDVGQSLHQMGQPALAMASLARALALRPDDAAIHTYVAWIHMEGGERDLSLASYRRALQLDPRPVTFSNTLFALSHCTNDPHELLAEHLRFGDLFERPLLALRRPHPNVADPARRINIGFVSADLYNHAVVTFVEPILELLTHSTELSLFAYNNGKVDDEVTARLRGYFPHWRSISALDDEAAERMIRADGIDILIDMSGHSGANRLPLFARKPAPLQISWLGYAGTTGLQAMDYYFTDGFHLPEGRYDDQFTEKIVRLPLGAPFMPAPNAPEISELPALRNGYMTFGTFNRANKLSREVIALWAKLLHAVPDARLLLGGLHPGADTLVLGWLRDQGIDATRLQLQPRGTVGEYLAAHDQVDICLGAFPYTGTTTVCHALWMGVPTLTNTGPTNPSHAAVCHMAHLGLTSFVADNDDHFVDLGVFLSQNVDELAQLRATMRQRFGQSVSGHPIIAASGLERGLRLIWERWCAGLPPESMRVRLSDLMTSEPALEPEA
ncbi:tetratricopeptide repeat protein [Massilia soli]|nr:tetratricopeptide repeat protein [Massilia soli]